MPRSTRSSSAKAGARKELKAATTGLALVDALSVAATPSIEDYVNAVSEYVRNAKNLSKGAPKRAQIALGAALGRALAAELVAKVPRMKLHSGELTVAGALRPARADVSEAHALDGLRLAIEIKPVNLAVGRALWNRFGDIRAFAVNIHLKFPFAVVGGVLVIPTWEEKPVSKKAKAQSVAEAAFQNNMRGEEPQSAYEIDDETPDDVESADDEEDVSEEDEVEALAEAGTAVDRKSTVHLIVRLISRLQRTRVRDTEADPAHLLEAVAVVVYDPDTGTIDPNLPPPGSKLRWDEFVTALAETYDVRFD